MPRVMTAALAAVFGGALLPAAPAAQGPPQGALQDQPRIVLPADTPSSSDATVRTAYILGSDDVLLVRVTDVPEIGAQPVRIDPAGDIRLPLAGTVRAAGKTLEELEAELLARLKVYIQEPDLSVAVTEFHSQPVSVIGAVRQSGVHQLQGARTLIEILSRAGGVGPEAGPTVRITRRKEWGRIPLPEAVEDASGSFTTVEIDLKALLAAQIPERNIMVRPHDVITVPEAEVVFVIGEVGRPGPLPLRGESVSVVEALSASGGALKSAAPANARILRKQAGSETVTEIEVDLRKIMQGQARDVRMVAGDILVVPDRPGRRGLVRALEMGAQAGISIATWGIVR